MKLAEKVALGAIGVIIVTNPASGQVILDLLDEGFKLIFEFGSPINFAASALVIAYIVYKMWEGREKTHIPKKTAKTLKAGRLIET